MCVFMCGCVGSAGASPPVTYVLSLVYRRHSLTSIISYSGDIYKKKKMWSATYSFNTNGYNKVTKPSENI